MRPPHASMCRDEQRILGPQSKTSSVAPGRGIDLDEPRRVVRNDEVRAARGRRDRAPGRGRQTARSISSRARGSTSIGPPRLRSGTATRATAPSTARSVRPSSQTAPSADEQRRYASAPRLGAENSRPAPAPTPRRRRGARAPRPRRPPISGASPRRPSGARTRSRDGPRSPSVRRRAPARADLSPAKRRRARRHRRGPRARAQPTHVRLILETRAIDDADRAIGASAGSRTASTSAASRSPWRQSALERDRRATQRPRVRRRRTRRSRAAHIRPASPTRRARAPNRRRRSGWRLRHAAPRCKPENHGPPDEFAGLRIKAGVTRSGPADPRVSSTTGVSSSLSLVFVLEAAANGPSCPVDRRSPRMRIFPASFGAEDFVRANVPRTTLAMIPALNSRASGASPLERCSEPRRGSCARRPFLRALAIDAQIEQTE